MTASKLNFQVNINAIWNEMDIILAYAPIEWTYINIDNKEQSQLKFSANYYGEASNDCILNVEYKISYTKTPNKLNLFMIGTSNIIDNFSIL